MANHDIGYYALNLFWLGIICCGFYAINAVFKQKSYKEELDTKNRIIEEQKSVIRNYEKADKYFELIKTFKDVTRRKE